MAQQITSWLEPLIMSAFFHGVNVGQKNDYVEALSQFLKNIKTNDPSLKLEYGLGDIIHLESNKNSQQIIQFMDVGFNINMNEMISEKQYLFSFEDSKYLIQKNKNDELVIKEIF